jgi:hypothetical protein
MNRECNVTKRVKTSTGLRYCPVVLSANGRIRPDAVIVNGKQENILKARITWNGGKALNVCAFPLARMLRTPAPVVCARKLN